MKKQFALSYLFIFIALLVSLSLSRPTSDKMRGRSIALFAPLWDKLLIAKHFILHPFQPTPTLTTLSIEEINQKLELENQLLSNEIAHLHQLFYHQQNLQNQLNALAAMASKEAQALLPDYQKTQQRLAKNLKLQIQAVPARVLFRSFDTWNNSLWINVGDADNPSNGNKIIVNNSPVLIGEAVVGVIDYVGTHQSRVRLITDSGLAPSVRAARGGEQEVLVEEQIAALLNQLQRKKVKSLPSADQEQLSKLLTNLKDSLQPQKKTWYLAKGQLQGSRRPTGRGDAFILKGTGFNYDFDDEEGGGRDLRTGKPLNEQGATIPILKMHDLLVTTGMDGVFPPGLKVATINKIHLLKEGDYFYEIEAKPLATHLQGLSLVFVIPPVGYEPSDTAKN